MNPSASPSRHHLPVVGSRSAVYEPLPPRPEGWGEGAFPDLTDARGRRYTYLRLSVTDRCDLACVYCMPPGGEDDHAVRRDLLSFEEAARMVTVFARMGVRRVRFTGGEPLVRKDVVRMVELVHRRTGLDDLAMTTNATRMGELARPLRDAGLSSINVSLDTLDPDRFREVTRGGDIARVRAGLHAALEAGFEVKLNVVPMHGVNEDELERIVDFAWDHGITPRFIELMPLGEGAKLDPGVRITADEVIVRLGSRVLRGPRTGVDGRGPAGYLEASDGSGRRVGFITALSDEFCGSCNRVRVTARGDIRACLAARRAVSLRDVMRGGGADADVAWAVHASLSGKHEGHRFLDAAAHEHEQVGMSLIGG
ncbi:MAG: GTP 3',8-cyclase MoaA [Myxococcota bacterium]